MRGSALLLSLMGLALGACAQENASPRDVVEQMEADAIVYDTPSGEAPVTQFGFSEQLVQGPTLAVDGGESARSAARTAAASARGNAATTEVITPGTQIAYAYSWGFQVEADDLPTLQQRHRDLCTAMGDDCRVLSLSQSGNDEYGYGRMQLQLVAGAINAFAEQLDAAGEDIDAKKVSFAIAGEDLTDDIIDNEARLQARTVLRDRLMEVLRNRQGSVAELVAAERGVAEVNEEIDATASRLENLRNRVTYTSVSIEYDPQLGHYTVGFWAPVAQALQSATSTLGVATAAIVYLVVGLLPFLLLFFALRWLWRRAALRLWRHKPKPGGEDAHSTDGEAA